LGPYGRLIVRDNL